MKSNILIFCVLLISMLSCASKRDKECQLKLGELTTSYHASGATRLHDMRRLRAINDARDFCVDDEIKIEEDRQSNELERAACPEELKSTRIIRVSCPKGRVKN